jgi:phage terminase large subunit-like protein
LIDGLSDNALCALPFDFDVWALPHQREPQGDWATWVIMGGRGAGKTRAGAEWVRGLVEGRTPVEEGICRRVALVGDTIDQVREVMIFGDSGIIACSPLDRRPKWNSTRKSLIWPNGAEAMVVSAQNPEMLRGPQFDAAWLDELAKWTRARDVWDMLQFTLRIGDAPRSMVTTTPRSQALLQEILEADDTVVTSAPTLANKANLADIYVRKIIADYAGTRLGRQEIYGELIMDVEGALWSLQQFENCRVKCHDALDRIVVAVDPPATSGEKADACGIVVVGAITQGAPQDWRAFVIADLTIENATPNQWAKVVCDAVKDFGADRVVAEVNQGGEMVEAVLRQHSGLVPYRAVRASRGKIARAEPISSLYEQGRVSHVGVLDDLEDQMVQMTFQGYQGDGSPDRVDALVWALTDLMVEPSQNYQQPRFRRL